MRQKSLCADIIFIEAIFNGNPEWGIERDPSATVLWVSDSPTLNEQTIYKFREATDLDLSLMKQ